jgi:hypothetical protein
MVTLDLSWIFGHSAALLASLRAMRTGMMLLLATLFGATHTFAADRERSRARLELHAAGDASSCMKKRELERSVERRLRRKVFEEPAELLVDVRFERADDRWKADIVLYDAERHELGRRDLDTAAKDCSSLDASLALVVALLVDSPPNPPAPVETSPDAAKTAPPPAPPRPTKIEVPKDTFAPREPWRFVPTATVSAAVDRLPGFAYGPRVGVQFLPPRFPEFRVSVGALLPKELKLESEDFGGRFWLVDALFELCPLAHETRSVRLSGCIGQSVGRLSVTGFGFDENDEEPGLDLVVTAGVSSFLMVARPFGVHLGLGAGFPLSRNAYSAATSQGQVEVWQRGYVVGSGEIGLGFEL